jgi:hypothetical protein
MIETLFVNNKTIAAPKEISKKAAVAPYKQERVLDPKKSQNIAILLRALNVTIEEVTEALLDGMCFSSSLFIFPILKRHINF